MLQELENQTSFQLYNDFVNGAILSGAPLAIFDLRVGGDNVINFEGLQGYINLVTGNDKHNTLIGGNLSNVLVGASGNNVIIGGSSNDLLYGASENVNEFGQSASVGGGNDQVFGGPGDDIIFALGGNDILSGDFGNDILFGGSGNDFLVGGFGIDTLFGGLGNDILIGGSTEGNDGVGDTYGVNPETGHDTVVGFEAGDKIGFSLGITNISITPLTSSTLVGVADAAGNLGFLELSGYLGPLGPENFEILAL